MLKKQRADQFTPIQLNAELQQREDSPDNPVPLLTSFLFDRTQDDEDADKHQGRIRYSLTLRVAKLTASNNTFDFREHLEQVPDWADTAIFDVGPKATRDGLEAHAAWNSDVQGANDQKDPIIPESCDIKHDNGQWYFQLPLPAAGRALPVLGNAAALLITITDRKQAADNRGMDLAGVGVPGHSE